MISIARIWQPTNRSIEVKDLPGYQIVSEMDEESKMFRLLIINGEKKVASFPFYRLSELDQEKMEHLRLKCKEVFGVDDESWSNIWKQIQRPPTNELFKIETPKEHSPLRKIISFSYIAPLWSKVRIEKDKEGEIIDAKTEYRLYKAIREEGQPFFILYDQDGFVNPKRHDYSVKVVDGKTLDRIIKEAPKKIFDKLIERTRIDKKKDEEIIQELCNTGFILTPIPSLKDTSILRNIDWKQEIVEPIINFKKVEMDERLKHIRKCTLLRGIKQSINPHSIIVLPGQTGKSDFYDTVGIKEDKASSKSVIGTADLDGPKPGSLHMAELPFAFDQIEESGAYYLFRYLLSLMESGKARVDNATYPFDVHCLSTLIILANPLGDPKNDFSLIVQHLSKNPALGRRFGIILYDYDHEGHKVQRLEKRERDLKGELAEKVSFFRAVEDCARDEIKNIINNEKVWRWLNEKNKDWIKKALSVVESLTKENEGLYQFLAEFIENGNTHTRGGALYGVIVDNLDKIALKEYDLDDILREAEDYLFDLLNINFDSLKNIVTNYIENKEDMIVRAFDSLPTYLKEIVSAVELLRRKLNPEQKSKIRTPYEIQLLKIPYTPKTKTYFSQVLLDAKKSNPAKYNEKLKSNFGLEIKEDGEFTTIVYSLDPITPINPLGVLGDLGNLEYFSGKSASDILSEDDSKIPKSPKTLKNGEHGPRVLTNCVRCGTQGSNKLVIWKGERVWMCDKCCDELGPEVKL